MLWFRDCAVVSLPGLKTDRDREWDIEWKERKRCALLTSRRASLENNEWELASLYP
jgi:hypothetical protein